MTETTWRGHPLTQLGQDGRQIRRWTSWYDPALVTQTGEDLLQSLDDWAVRFFRKEKLIWSAWGPMQKLTSNYTEFYSERLQIGLRNITYVDTKKFRLFFLSVLWRAAACKLWEFENVKIAEDDLRKLRRIIVSCDPEPWDFFPLSLIQLCTQTIPFNQAVFRWTKNEPGIDAHGEPDFSKPQAIDFFRIYFDGLVGSLNIEERAEHFSGARSVFVTDDPTIQILVLPSERSSHVSKVNFERGVPVPYKHLEPLLGLQEARIAGSPRDSGRVARASP